MIIHPILDFPDLAVQHNHAVGLLASLTQTGNKRFPLGEAIRMVDDAVRTGGIQAYADTVGRAIGLVCWQTCNRYARDRAIREVCTPAPKKKGKYLWITGLFAQPGALAAIRAHMRDHLLIQYTDATYISASKDGHKSCKRVQRSRETSIKNGVRDISLAPLPLHTHVADDLIEYGRILRALTNDDCKCRSPLETRFNNANRFVANGLYDVIDIQGAPEACFAWAWLSDEVIDRLDQKRVLENLEISELNEGKTLCLYFCSATDKCVRLLHNRIVELARDEARVGFVFNGQVTWACPENRIEFEKASGDWIARHITNK